MVILVIVVVEEEVEEVPMIAMTEMVIVIVSAIVTETGLPPDSGNLNVYCCANTLALPGIPSIVALLKTSLLVAAGKI